MPTHGTSFRAWSINPAPTGQPHIDPLRQTEYDLHWLPDSAQTPGCWLHRGVNSSHSDILPVPTPDNNPVSHTASLTLTLTEPAPHNAKHPSA
jgi:hypothetical protein